MTNTSDDELTGHGDVAVPDRFDLEYFEAACRLVKRVIHCARRRKVIKRGENATDENKKRTIRTWQMFVPVSSSMNTCVGSRALDQAVKPLMSVSWKAENGIEIRVIRVSA